MRMSVPDGPLFTQGERFLMAQMTSPEKHNYAYHLMTILSEIGEFMEDGLYGGREFAACPTFAWNQIPREILYRENGEVTRLKPTGTNFFPSNPL